MFRKDSFFPKSLGIGLHEKLLSIIFARKPEYRHFILLGKATEESNLSRKNDIHFCMNTSREGTELNKSTICVQSSVSTYPSLSHMRSHQLECVIKHCSVN